MRLTTLTILLLALACGCESDRHHQQRQQKLSAQGRAWLLAKYPLGRTTRAEIRKQFVRSPDLATTRPSGGWNAPPTPVCSDFVLKSEARTGKSVFHVDAYFGPVGERMVPGFLWFFFDDDDRLIDTDFEPHSI